MRLAGVLRPPNDANVYGVAIRRERAMPLDAGVGTQNDIGLVMLTEFLQETIWCGTFPEKLIHLPGRAVTHIEAIVVQLRP